MEEGQTFLFPNADDDRLWMIISDPRKDAAQVVMVRFLSFREDLEETLIVTSGSILS